MSWPFPFLPAPPLTVDRVRRGLKSYWGVEEPAKGAYPTLRIREGVCTPLKHVSHNHAAGAGAGSRKSGRKKPSSGSGSDDDSGDEDTLGPPHIDWEEEEEDEQHMRKWPRNAQSTTKYTLWNFPVKNLAEQYRLATNQFFLLVCIVILTPLSPLNPVTSVMPVVFVLGVTAVREGYEDWRRSKADEEVNKREFCVLNHDPMHDGPMLTWDGHGQEGEGSGSGSGSDSDSDSESSESGSGEDLADNSKVLHAPYRKVQSQNLKVGDVVRLDRDQTLPADLLVLATGLEDGLCFVETSQLDGETNLKLFQAIPETQHLDPTKDFSALDVNIQCSQPDRDLFDFYGNIRLNASQHEEDSDGSADDSSGSDDAHVDLHSLGQKQLLLRGASLRNTPWAIGIVVYSGRDTKLSLNQSVSPSKFSQVSKKMNRIVVGLFILIMVGSLAGGIGAVISTESFAPDTLLTPALYYDEDAGNAVYDSIPFLNFVPYFVLLSFFIPMSLMVTLEVVKVAQTLFMEWDPYMRFDEDDEAELRAAGAQANVDLGQPHSHSPKGEGARAKTSNLNDELGLVKWIFSDKTGTLTDNKMTFAKCAVREQTFQQPLKGDLGDSLQTGKWRASKHKMTSAAEAAAPLNSPHAKDSGSDSDSSASEGVAANTTAPNHVADFLYALALCHGALANEARDEPKKAAAPSADKAEKKKPEKDGDVESGCFKFRRTRRLSHDESADELAERVAAKQKKKQEKKQDSSSSDSSEDDGNDSSSGSEGGDLIDQFGKDPSLIRFESQSPDEIALCDAARANGFAFLGRRRHDTILSVHGETQSFEAIVDFEFSSARGRQSTLFRTPDDKYVMYAKGSDAVMLARARADDAALESTKRMLNTYARQGLRTLVVGMRVFSKDEYKELMKEFTMANTAVQNREDLVNDVADKWEQDYTILGSTAIEDHLQHGVSDALVYLIRAGIKVWMVTGDKQETAESIGYSTGLVDPDLPLCTINATDTKSCEKILTKFVKKYARGKTAADAIGMLIDGKTLYFALTDHSELFLELAMVAKSVVACRVAPLQKAQIVKLIRSVTDDVTLSIGDGANDVAMIQAAHVGVGIFGKEGTQAARASDYAIHRFRFLRRLVCVHGRYSFLRNAALIKSSLYKNYAYMMVQFWFAFFCAFSGQTVYDDWFITGYNITFTSLPSFFLGLLEKDAKEDEIACIPELYRAMATGKLLGKWPVLGWLASATWHSLVIYFIGFQAFLEAQDASSGLIPGGTIGFRWAGGYLAILGLTVVWAKVALETHFWTGWNVLGHILSPTFCTITLLLLSFAGYGWWAQGVGIFQSMVTTPSLYFNFFLTLGVALLPDIFVKVVRRLYWPHDWEIVSEIRAGENEGAYASKQCSWHPELGAETVDIDEHDRIHGRGAKKTAQPGAMPLP